MTPDAGDLAAALARGPGAHEAFARIYDRHAPVVRALCRRHSSSDAETDDALQETFIRAYRLLDRVSEPSGLRSWLFQIAAMVCSERRRSASRRVRHELASTDFGGLRLSAHAQAMASPVSSVEHAEQLERLSLALDELPDDERLAIHLYYLESDPVAAAGATLGCSRSGFYKLLSRARERLGSILTRATA